MSSLYSSQYGQVTTAQQKFVSEDIQCMVAEFTPAAEMTTSDTLYLGKLPSGARVLRCFLIFPASGATGIVDIGYQANGVDVADLNAFVAGADPGAAAVAALGTGAGIGLQLGADTNVVMTPSENTASATGNEIKVFIEYVVG